MPRNNDDSDVRPAKSAQKKKKKAKKSNGNPTLIIGLAVGGAVAVLAGIGICVAVIVISGKGKGPAGPNGPAPVLPLLAASPDLKTKIVGKWNEKGIGGRKGFYYIQFTDTKLITNLENFRGDTPLQVKTFERFYKIIDANTIEVTHRDSGLIVSVPIGARTTEFPDVIENGKVVRRAYVLVHTNYRATLVNDNELQLTPPGGIMNAYTREVTP